MMQRVTPEEWLPRGVAALEPKALTAVKDDGSAIVVAGPGAGKTELLAQRASYLLETGLCPAPRRILAISFKRDAARNIRERVALRCGSSIARRFVSFTFDAFAKSLVDRFLLGIPKVLRPTGNYVLDFNLESNAHLRERVNALAGPATGLSHAQLQAVQVKQFYSDYVIGRPLSASLPPNAEADTKVAWAFWQHALHLGDRSALNFPMLDCLAEFLLRANPLIRTALRTTYAFVFLDEFQDTTGVQYRLLHTAFHGSEAVLTAVGDHKQRIMLWAGALEGVFDVFRQEFAATPRGLDMNYRSAPKLVAIQQHLIASLDPHSPMPVAADDGANGEGECRVFDYPDSQIEADDLAAKIEGWMNEENLRPNDICILVRKLAVQFSGPLRAALENRNIESRVENELQDLLAEPLTVMAGTFFRLASRPRDGKSWTTLIEMVLRYRGITEEDIEARTIDGALRRFTVSLRELLEGANGSADIASAIEGILDFVGKSTFSRLHPQYMQGDFLEKTIHYCAAFLADARVRKADWPSALDDFFGVNCIPIMTIAKSKGLEFHTVVLLGLEDFAFRHPAGNDAEEECNFFVAFSRAKKRAVETKPCPSGLSL